METKIPVNKTNTYTTIQDCFLAHWVSTIGLGPAMLYLQLLSYCHKGKDIAWPSIQTLNKRMGTTTKTLIKYRNTLLEYGLIKKVVKQKSSSGGYDHNLYQIVLLDKENILYPPKEKLPEENEEIISGISEEFPYSNQDNPNKIVPDNKKSLKTERIKEELEKLNMDKKSIYKTILNYSLEDIEEKIDLLRIKRNVVNPVGWLIAALKANYLNPESSKEENDEEEKIMETEEIESESKIVKLNKLALKKKEKEEKDRLFMEESLKWIEQNLVKRFEM
ncbi:MAG: helix-turn-helix domain-containing protein [Thermoplasmata archaeon]|nr:helix-turn-helix domain-containing protein [Thermoplasmata archaeon]